ncbi:MAG TPA: hypothetical protein VEJ88_06655 [Dissulfurispiraceae bacterium]|nr:hypothetical protein [Dissulfurispiraceae bacterium]
MTSIRFRHHDDKYDMVNASGLQTCIDRGIVKEFYRPSEKRWIDPLKDPIRKNSDSSFPASSDRRSNCQPLSQNDFLAAPTAFSRG